MQHYTIYWSDGTISTGQSWETVAYHLRKVDRYSLEFIDTCTAHLPKRMDCYTKGYIHGALVYNKQERMWDVAP